MLVHMKEKSEMLFSKVLGKGIPARYVFTILGFWGMVQMYAMRINLSVAIVAMVNNTGSHASHSPTTNYTDCFPVETEEANPKIIPKGGQFNWDSNVQGMVLGSFFYSHFITQLPGAILARWFGSKWVFGVGGLISAICCLVGPIAAELGAPALMATRVIAGLGEGVTIPAIVAMISEWAPVMERTVISTIIQTGVGIGTMMGSFMSAWICSSEKLGGWSTSFYWFGGVTCVWFLLWALCIYEKPKDHPRITEKEMHRINEGRETETLQKSLPVPWKKILTSIPMWALVIAHVGHVWGFNMLFTELPTYLNDVLRFDLKSNGLLSALPFFMQSLVGCLTSFLADKIRTTGRFSISTIRKIFNTIGFVAPALCLLGVTFSSCRPYLIVGLITGVLAINAFMYSGFTVTHVDMSPNFAGTMYGITNTFANVTGFIGPAVVGVLISNGSTSHNWNYVFYITAVIYAITAVVFVIFGTAELQSWNEPTSPDVHRQAKCPPSHEPHEWSATNVV